MASDRWRERFGVGCPPSALEMEPLNARVPTLQWFGLLRAQAPRHMKATKRKELVCSDGRVQSRDTFARTWLSSINAGAFSLNASITG
jgi:hypothetical protein